ncbi:MAG: hypothetical protein EOP41_01705 [Sphingobacteriaceae bacterium]|nr:MAG: hypothetical protein EOP41_01705 [Sphingobacteriaceae bacterium]
MANITEKDIITYLKEKIKSIQADAKKYEDLLNAFNGASAISKPAKQSKDSLMEAVLEQAEEVTVKAPKKKAEPKAPKAPKTTKMLEVPAEYTPELSLGSKIAFAINEIGGAGFGQDIANSMAQYEPQSDADKIFKQIASVLSNLKAKGALTTVKEGRKDKYSLAK